jgi:hypothetical protein
VADDNAAKQHAANAKPDAADFDIADPQSDDRHQRQTLTVNAISLIVSSL